MKKLILPLAIALFCGIGGGTALTVLRTPKAAPVDSTAAHSAKPAAQGNEAESQADARDEPVTDDSLAHTSIDSLMTPAESLRAVVASRLPLKTQSATRGLRDAVADSTRAAAPALSVNPAKPSVNAADSKPDSVKSKQATPSLQDAVEAVRGARSTALATAIPEERLAKIFSAMQAKDAARVLDQMEDRDIRAVLSLMGDRQVAAILSALPAPRAATITRGALKASGADK